MSVLTGRRAVLRLAARDARRHKGRSALVVAMVALPVLVLSAVDVVARTGEAAGRSGGVLERPTGRADAFVRVNDGPVQQSPDGQSYAAVGASFAGGPAAPPTAEQVAADLGAERVVVDARTSGRYTAPDGSRRVEVRQLDADDPLTEGLVTVVDGRAPATGDEAAVTADVLRTAGLALGDELALTRPDRVVTVVGTVEQSGFDTPTVLVLPGTVQPAPGAFTDVRYVVETQTPITWDEVLELNGQGYVVTSAAVLADPPPREQVPLFAQEVEGPGGDDVVALVVLAAGMALLEVVLLAGPAVAVGARRSRRLLALLAACGGDRRQVRDVVLGQGLVLGGVAAGAGVGLGVLLGVAAVPVVERVTDTPLPAPVLRPLDLLALALVAAVTAVLASVVPARSVSRQDTGLALAGRREPLRTRRRVPAVGVVLALVGLALVLRGVDGREPVTILGGAALGQVGLVLCTPALVLLAGRLGGRLPLTPRMALRDGARHVGRTAPAVSAVMAAVAGSVAVGIFVASQSEHDRLQYTQSLPIGDASVHLDPFLVEGSDLDQVQAVLTRALPVDDAVVLRSVDGFGCREDVCTSAYVQVPARNQCPGIDGPADEEDLERLRDDPRCGDVFDGRRATVAFPFSTLVDDGTALAVLLGRDVPEARRALAEGAAVVVDPLLLQDGTVTLGVTESDATGAQQRERTVELPAVAVPGGDLDALPPQLVLPPQTAERLGIPGRPTSLYVQTSRTPTRAEEQAANTALDRAGFDAGVSVERGYQDAYLPGLLALVVGAAVITLGAAATATGLAMTDARPDLATLAAVGAGRRVRRRLSVSTSLVITVLGTLLGGLAGAVPGVAAVRALQQPEFPTLVPDNGWPLVVPWPSLLVTAVAVPLLAAVGAAVLTRGRLPMTRRAAG